MPNEPADDPQVDALVRASGHSREDAWVILTELNKIGWTVRPITSFFEYLTPAQRDLCAVRAAELFAKANQNAK